MQSGQQNNPPRPFGSSRRRKRWLAGERKRKARARDEEEEQKKQERKEAAERKNLRPFGSSSRRKTWKRAENRRRKNAPQRELEKMASLVEMGEGNFDQWVAQARNICNQINRDMALRNAYVQLSDALEVPRIQQLWSIPSSRRNEPPADIPYPESEVFEQARIIAQQYSVLEHLFDEVDALMSQTADGRIVRSSLVYLRQQGRQGDQAANNLAQEVQQLINKLKYMHNMLAQARELSNWHWVRLMMAHANFNDPNHPQYQLPEPLIEAREQMEQSFIETPHHWFRRDWQRLPQQMQTTTQTPQVFEDESELALDDIRHLYTQIQLPGIERIIHWLSQAQYIWWRATLTQPINRTLHLVQIGINLPIIQERLNPGGFNFVEVNTPPQLPYPNASLFISARAISDNYRNILRPLHEEVNEIFGPIFGNLPQQLTAMANQGNQAAQELTTALQLATSRIGWLHNLLTSAQTVSNWFWVILMRYQRLQNPTPEDDWQFNDTMNQMTELGIPFPVQWFHPQGQFVWNFDYNYGQWQDGWPVAGIGPIPPPGEGGHNWGPEHGHGRGDWHFMMPHDVPHDYMGHPSQRRGA